MNESSPLTGKILVIDDEPAVAEVLAAFLTEEGHDVTVLLMGSVAMQGIKEDSFDVILTDLNLPDLGGKEAGLQILEFTKQVDSSIEVIIIMEEGTLHAIKEAMRAGAYDLLVKPFDGAEIVLTVANSLLKHRLKEERNQLVREVEQVRAEQRELFDLATRDGLTNLYNYRYFQTQLERLMAKRAPQNPVSLVMIDADNFKIFNDRYGHLRGDEILRTIARVLTSHIRDTDIAARCGGDEFSVLLPETNEDQALAFAERCVRLVPEYKLNETDSEHQLTISIGIASYPKDAANPRALMAAADHAMYAAKSAGGNRVHTAG